MTRFLAALRTGAAGVAISLLAPSSPAHASKCESSAFNPITKVRWTCIFPITIGGVKIGPSDPLGKALDAQTAAKPLCACPFDADDIDELVTKHTVAVIAIRRHAGKAAYERSRTRN